MQIHELSALQLADLLRRGELSAAEVCEHTAGRIATIGAAVGAFAHTAGELAARQAAAADQSLAAARAGAGGAAGPMCGVPVPIKDLTQVAGVPFEAGSAVLRGNIATVSDGVYARFEEAGTVMVGKTSTPEFGFPPYTEPVTGPPARTPWDLARTAGGSSGGAAAAVAAGVVPVAHGSDGGGSIRIPAACCGVLGMKPTRGRISQGPHFQDGPGLVCHGVITRTVSDSAAFLDLLSGPLPGDPFFPHPPSSRGASGGRVWRDAAPSSFLASCHTPLAALRIGVLLEPLNVDDVALHPHAAAGVARAVRHLEEAGHQVMAAPRAMNGQEWMSFMPLWAASAAGLPIPPHAEGLLRPLTQYLRALGRGIGAAAYAGALAGMQALARKVAAAWSEFDVILTPTLSGPPAYPGELQLEDPAADFEAQKRFTPWTSVWNMTGAPSVSVPLHRAEVGGRELPFGIMLGAVQPGDEAILFALAAELERRDPWPLIREVTA